MFDNIGGGELMLIMLAILFLFGPKKIPELAQGLGKGLREFKKAQQEFKDNISKVVGDEDLKNIADSVNSIKTDMSKSVQKLTEHLQTAVEQPESKPVTPASPVTPAPPANPAS
jgi:sec-independent protein translocase protein TatA